MIFARTAVLLSFAALSASPAQSPIGADTLGAKAIAESLAVLKTLDAAVRANDRDAAAWHRRGMIAWALAQRARTGPPVKGLDISRLDRVSDVSLGTAADLDPNNVRYQLAIGRRLLVWGDAGARAVASRRFEAALEAARAGTDRELHLIAAIETARVHWRRYDALANRVAVAADAVDPKSMTDLQDQTIAARGTDATIVTGGVTAERGHSPSMSGELDYRKAETLFREAYRVAPGNARAFWELAMLLVEGARWSELGVLARDGIARAPSDPWAWMALGLSQQRSGRSTVAAATFDTAAMRFDARERMRLMRLTRLLPRHDSVAYAATTDLRRANTDTLYWLMADPLWSTKGEDPRTEFLARVAYAEFRWSVEELGRRGADTDRGNIYVRYGPPVVVRATGPKGSASNISQQGFPGTQAGNGANARAKDITHVKTVWVYDADTHFIFYGPATFATAEFLRDDLSIVDSILEATPSRWDNVARARILDMPARMARFRATHDSVELMVATRAPLDSMRRSAGANVPVRADFWLSARGIPDAYHDGAEFDGSGARTWVYRVRPATYLYRIEAVAEGALVAGRTMAWVDAGADSGTGFPTRGFGMSDVLPATLVAPRTATAARWSDVRATPLLGAVRKNGQLELVWENYDFGARSGAANYEITVTFARERSASGRIAAELLGAIGSAVGVDRRNDRVVFRFDRAVPHAPTMVDHVTLGIGVTPAGTYRVTVSVTDRVTGRTATRSFGVTITE